RAGLEPVAVPERMDSEGLLALPELRDVRGIAVGLVTAPGGRDAIAPALRARGAQVRRADVYRRLPLPPSPRTLARLR
ncbi:uroporphyrinogen-III synthase, partial [Acinetobacter baumannii]